MEMAVLDHVREVERAGLCGATGRDDYAVQSWRRCLTEYRLDPAAKCEAVILPEGRLKEHRQQTEATIMITRSGLDRLYDHVSGQDYVLLLADRQGIVVEYFGDPRQSRELQRAGLYLGTDWAETRAGTCAVGAYTATGEVLTIHQSDHFDLFHTPLSCTATPIHNTAGALRGGMAEATIVCDYIVYDYNVEKIPDSLSDEEAALVEPAAVAVYSCDRGGLRVGSSVLVTGAEPIGSLTLLAARAAGAGPLFLADLNVSRLAFAWTVLPDTTTFNPKRDDNGEAVRAATEGGVGCDVALECVGNEHGLKACLDAVHKQGVVAQSGLHRHENPLDWFEVTFKDVDLRGAWAYLMHYWPRVIRLIASGALPAAKIVTGRINLKDAVAQGLENLLDPAAQHLKILIDLNG
jgi:threonine dehydrogenase-like Zn-dependent dehydrogenase